MARGVIQREVDDCRCTAGEEAEVPPSRQDRLLSRVDGLAPDGRGVLQEAAVLGAEFDASVLRVMASAPDGVRDVDTAWRRAVIVLEHRLADAPSAAAACSQSSPLASS